jgi:hypothetical protein
MRIVTGLAVLAATAAVATGALAEARLSDVDYLKAARCRGLAGSEALGALDTTALDAKLKAQSRGRPSYIADKADATRKDAERAAKRAGPERKPALIAERDGPCAAYMS